MVGGLTFATTLSGDELARQLEGVIGWGVNPQTNKGMFGAEGGSRCLSQLVCFFGVSDSLTS